jgi:ATP-binding protein involved in chromosome partitioning
MGGDMQNDLLKDGRVFPSNFGPMRDADGNARVTGPCGDTMEFWIRGRDGQVSRVTYITDGCAHSIISGSAAGLLTEGKAAGEAARIGQEDVLAAVGGLPEESRHCALLAATALKAAVADYIRRNDLDVEGKCDAECGECGKEDCGARTLGPGEESGELAERQAMRRRMSKVRHKLLVLSGKGGVGKSTIAVNLAVSLSLAGKRTGLLDVDMHGPSVPGMLLAKNAQVHVDGKTIFPLEAEGLKVMSIGFFLRNPDDAVIWRGPMKIGVIKQFLRDVEWGDLDYLVIDSPPGTGDEPLSVCQLIQDADGAVIVTTPQDVATADVRKSINFCKTLKLPILGVIENMSGFACPNCGQATEIFKAGGGERMAGEMGVPFLGRIPIDPAIGIACDDGKPYVRNYARTETAKAFENVVSRIAAGLNKADTSCPSGQDKPIQAKESVMRIAIPIADGKLSMHFGHCDKFCIVEADVKAGKALNSKEVDAPAHQPGLLPKWLAEQGVQVVIAGGMGQRALALFAERNIEVFVGAPAESPDYLVARYLDGSLKSGDNVCDH